MAITSLPPGFRFHPTDVELVKYYLKRKVLGKRFSVDAIADVDIYKYGPWDLPDKSSLRSKDLKWYFFCARGKKYATGARMNRATGFGFWKATGNDRSVEYNNEVVGMIKTLVFHRGKPPKGDRTDWVMHEYRLEDKDLADKGVVQDAYVLCAIFQKTGRGPRNGDQYGAPFNEEDWSDDEEVDLGEAASSAGLSGPGFVLPNKQISSVATTTHLPEGMCIGTSKLCLSNTLPSSYNVLQPYSVVPMEASQVQNDNMVLGLECFGADGTLVSDENNSNEKLDNLSQGGNVEAPSSGLDGNDLIMGLEDLCNLDNLSQDGNVEAPYSGLDGNVFIMEFEALCKHDNLSQDGNVEDPSFGMDGNVEDSSFGMDGNDCFMELGDLGNLGGLSEGGYNFSSSYQPPYTPHHLDHVDHTTYLELQDLNDPLKSLAVVSAPEHIQTHVDYSCYNNPQQLTYPVNPCGAAQHVFGLNQFPSMLPRGPHGFEDHEDVFHKGNGANGGVNQGYGSCEAALYNWDVTPFEQSGK